MSAVALGMAAVPNVKADGAFLSPRAQDHQIEIVSPPGTNATVVTSNKIMPNAGAFLSPGARGHQIVKVAGTNSDPDLVSLGLTPSEYVIMVEYGVTPTASASPHSKVPQSMPSYEIAPVK